MKYRIQKQAVNSVMLIILMTCRLLAASGPILPGNGTFSAGKGAISTAGNTLTVNQTSNRGIIDWNNFSIGQNGKVFFHNGSGATLNLVNGGAITSILGTLLATGSVYILNPEGVVIGATGRVNTGGDFVASSLRVSNDAFMRGGSLLFQGGSNAVIKNLGAISSTGGSVFLIGNEIQNSGNIHAAAGTVGLGAGHGILLKDSSSDQRIFVQAKGGDVTTSGSLSGAEVEVKAAGGNIYALAGNNGGQIRATGSATRDGQVWLVATDGNLNAAGEISAHNADGAGGRIETSGKSVSTSKLNISTGRGGAWLLDPDDLTIDSALASSIEGTLATGLTDVTEQTSAPTSGGQGDINVNSSISWSTNASLTLSAYRDINVANGVTISNVIPISTLFIPSASLTLRADNASTGVGTVNFLGSVPQIDYSQSLGRVSLLYNPAAGGSGKYNNAHDYSSNVTANGAWTAPADGSLSSQFTPYMLVNNMTDLQNVNTNLAGVYGLGTDLDAGGVSNFSFIGTGGNTFSGTFDGQGHIINNLSISSTEASVGFIGTNTGYVRNVGLMNANVSGTGAVTGGLVGTNYGHVDQSFVNGQIHGSQEAGGLVGQNNISGFTDVGIINDSYSAGNVSSDTYQAGGLVGQNETTINNSYSSAIAPYGVDAIEDGNINDTFWDIQNSGTYQSGGGNSRTRNDLQNSLSQAWSGDIWSVGNGSYPFLKWQIPTGTSSVAVFGFAYADQSQHNNGIVNAPVKAIINAADLGLTIYTGADGYYSYVLNNSQAPDGSRIITYLPTQARASSFYDDFHSFGFLPITANYLTMTSQNPSLTAAIGSMQTGGGSLIAGQNLPFSVAAGNILHLQPGWNLDLVGATTPITLDQPLTTFSNLILEEFSQVTQSASSPLHLANLSILAACDCTLMNPGNLINTLATARQRNNFVEETIVVNPLSNTVSPFTVLNGLNIFSGSNLTLGTTDAATGIFSSTDAAIATSGGLTIDYGITVEARSSGIPLVLADGTTFVNHGGPNALRTFNGNWQVWSQDPRNDNRGNEAYDFKQYQAAYNIFDPSLSTTPAQNTGNAFFYAYQPVVIPSLLPITRQYNATTVATLAGYSPLTGIDGDTVTLVNPPSTGVFSDKNIGINKTVTVTGLTQTTTALDGAANVYGYFLNPVLHNNIGTITKAPLVVTTSASNKVYDGSSLATGNAVLSNPIAGDVVRLAVPGVYSFANKNVGNGKAVTVAGLSLAGTDAQNYSFTTQNTVANITPATISQPFTGVDKVYDGGTQAAVTLGALSGIVSGDNVTLQQNGAVFNFLNKNAGAGKSITAAGGILSGEDASNYIFAFSQTGSTSISPAPLTLGFTAASKVYNGFTATTGSLGDLTGLVSGDSVATSGMPAFNFPTKNAGTSPVLLSNISLSGADAGNYRIVPLQLLSASITPAALFYTADPSSRSYGLNNPAFTGTVSGLVAGDTLGSIATGSLLFSSPATPLSYLGTHPIYGSGLTLSGGNYTLAQAAANSTALSITPLTLAINSVSRAVGQPNVFTLSYNGTGSLAISLASILSNVQFQTNPPTSLIAGIYQVTGAYADSSLAHAFNFIPGTLSVTDTSTITPIPPVFFGPPPPLDAGLPVNVVTGPNISGTFEIGYSAAFEWTSFLQTLNAHTNSITSSSSFLETPTSETETADYASGIHP